MAIAVITDLPDVTRAQYETARKHLGDRMQTGNLVHMAGPTEGGWRVIEVWESPEAVAAFFGSEAARNAFQAAQIPPAQIPPAQPTVFPIHTLAAVASMLP